MTTLPPTEFTLVTSVDAATLTVRVAGELDYDTSDDLLRTVIAQLPDGPALREVHLDFGELAWIDSSGLSALLMIHRRTSAVGATLYLDNRPEVLDRMLHMTNVLDHLTAPVVAAGGQEEQDDGGGERDEKDDGLAEVGAP